MATIRKEIPIAASADDVWDVLCDLGAIHTRLAPGFVVDTVLEAGARVVTFVNGFIVRELIVDLDDAARRLAYAAVGSELMSHHHASFEVVAEGADHCRLIWSPTCCRTRRQHRSVR